MELGFMELMKPAAVIVDECLKIQPGEKVVITTDSRNHENKGQEPLIQALMAVMAERGIDPTMICYEGRYLSSPNIPEIAALAIDNADVVIGVNSVLLLQSQAMPMMWANHHTRCLLLPSGINISWSPDEIYRMLPKTKEEMLESSELSRYCASKFSMDSVTKLHVTAANGTDLTLDFIPDPKISGGIAVGDGLCDKPGMGASFPGGGVTCLGGDGDVNGKLVLDTEISLHSGLLPDAATLTYKDGKVVSVEGSGTTASLIRDFLAGLDASVASNECPEFGIGCNKRAQVNGNSSEGESIYGAVHFGVGFLSQDHFDAILPKATLEINGELLIKDGEFCR